MKVRINRPTRLAGDINPLEVLEIPDGTNVSELTKALRTLSASENGWKGPFLQDGPIKPGITYTVPGVTNEDLEHARRYFAEKLAGRT